MGHIGCWYPCCCCYSQTRDAAKEEKTFGVRRGYCPCRPMWQVACAAPCAGPGSGLALLGFAARFVPLLLLPPLVVIFQQIGYFIELPKQQAVSPAQLSPLPPAGKPYRIVTEPWTHSPTLHMRLVWLYWPKQATSLRQPQLASCPLPLRVSPGIFHAPCPHCPPPSPLLPLPVACLK